ncbi:MAG: hypothetical protein KVP17_002989 [Porospora cf. gigantea B]|uniref:uncharacterized protein n=1 Tax=Porospora cf. gigantea B TaxID=2853592 RepID=UPI0035719042|nr:MAG: hypothetical protein KVP17_002989 [Porospora cf. gigantea B]
MTSLLDRLHRVNFDEYLDLRSFRAQIFWSLNCFQLLSFYTNLKVERAEEKSKATAKYGLVGLLGLTEDDAHKFFGINFQQVSLS